MELRSIPPIAETCELCDKEANITCIAYWDVWFCSERHYYEWIGDNLGLKSWNQFYYLVEQQKQVLDIVRDADAAGLLNPFA